MKLNLKHCLAVAAVGFSINSCAFLDQFSAAPNQNADPIDYLEKAPKLDVKNFFSGDLEGFAIMQDEDGKINNSFTAKVSGKWEESRGTVQFSYTYNGGKKDSRTWLYTINDANNYSAIGHDFIETAQGRNQGNASLVNYSLNINFEETRQRINFEDQMFLVDDKSAILISTMKKGSKVVGKAIISLKKIN